MVIPFRSAEYHGLIDDVTSNPTDPTPRLILADWLEDNGGAAGARRAAMIRGTWDGKGPLRFAQTFHELRKLDALMCKVTGGSPMLVVDGKVWRKIEAFAGVIDLRRGFCFDVVCPLATWKRCGGALLFHHPVESIRLPGREPQPLIYQGDDGTSPPKAYWSCSNGHDYPGHHRETLPQEVFIYLKGGRRMENSWVFDTAEDAYAGLTKAMMRMLGVNA